MLRTFNQHDVRAVETLDGWWDFVIEPERSDRAKLPKHYSRRIQTPRAWEMLPGLEAYRGRAWLRRTITSSGGAVRLVFGGVSHTANVYLDGRHVAHHYDAFTPFAAAIPDLKPGEHELVVEVDNSFGGHSALHIENDYYTYGGITRPAELQAVPDAFIERVDLAPRRTGRTWALDAAVTVRNVGRDSARRTIAVEVAGWEADFGAATVPPGATRTVRRTIDGLDVEPWSTATPVLYRVITSLLDGHEVVDDLIDRVGFREVAVRGRKLLLNGEPLRLRGYNRHEDHPGHGCAIPQAEMVRDLEIIRDLGGNFVRTCHYPNDMRFLDLCDEMGLYVWEESHARNVDFKHPKFREQIADSTREMVEWHRNHPCIFMWGCLNECDSVSRAGRREHKRVIELIRKLDDTRPVTFASNKPHRDICLDLVDVVSWNAYTGWYQSDIPAVAGVLAKCLKWLHSSRSGAKGKPLIMSEFGAGAIPGFRHPARPPWSEQYQADVLDEELRVYLNHPDIVGAAIWQFCDVRITRHWWRQRPRSMNNKGTVDEFRRPKLAYDVVKHRLHQAAEGLDER